MPARLAAACVFTTIVCALALARSPDARAAEPVTLAVSAFDNTAASAELAPLGKGLADMLITDLATSDELVLVERERLEAVRAELSLQRTPWADKASAVKLGKGLGAAYLLTGAYLAARDVLRVDVRVVDVESGAVVFTTKAERAPAEFFALERELAEALLEGLGARLTLLAKKRLGAGATHDLKAFEHYCRALDAHDRGDAKAERDALGKALAADPEFGRAKARIAALEQKVEALERAGGRIMRPASAADHLHNARIDKTQGRAADALASVKLAALADPGLADVWVVARELGLSVAVGRELVGKRPERAAVEAFLGGDVAALGALVAASKNREAVLASVLLFELLAPELPARTLTRGGPALAACDALEAAGAGGLAGVVVDPAGLLARVAAVRARHFAGDRAERTRTRAYAAFVNRAGYNLLYRTWELVVLIDEPAKELGLKIERETRHPHWNDKPPARAHRLDLKLYTERYPAKRPALEAALATPDTFVYQMTRDVDPYVPLEADPPEASRFGERLAVPARSLLCKANAQSPTGTTCKLAVYVPFAVVQPGLYRVTLDYRDADGVSVHATVPAWGREVELIGSRGPRDDEVVYKPAQLFHRLADLAPTDRTAVVRELDQKKAGKRALTPALVVMAVTWFRNHLPGEDPPHTRYVDRIAYDVDYALGDGKPIAEDDWAAWRRYRDAIIERGWAVKSDEVADLDWLALPALTPGPHTICVATVRADGGRSAEAECSELDVP